MIPPVRSSAAAVVPVARAVAAQREKHTHAAQQLVSQLFYVPLLAEVRRSNLGGTIGHGGRGEEIFGEQLDVQIADAVARNQTGGLVAQVVRDLARREGAPTDVSATGGAWDALAHGADRARVKAALQTAPSLSLPGATHTTSAGVFE